MIWFSREARKNSARAGERASKGRQVVFASSRTDNGDRRQKRPYCSTSRPHRDVPAPGASFPLIAKRLSGLKVLGIRRLVGLGLGKKKARKAVEDRGLLRGWLRDPQGPFSDSHKRPYMANTRPSPYWSWGLGYFKASQGRRGVSATVGGLLRGEHDPPS